MTKNKFLMIRMIPNLLLRNPLPAKVMTMVSNSQRLIYVFVACGVTIGLMQTGSITHAQPDTTATTTQIPATTNDTTLQNTDSAERSKINEEHFSRWLNQHDALAEGIGRAWEYRPYRVAVWLCLDGSPQLNSILRDLVEDLHQRAELIDPSAWNMHFGEAPSQYRSLFLQYLAQPDKCAGFEKLPILRDYDKLMIVCLNQTFESTLISVRECDLTTLQWGPIQNRRAGYFSQILSVTMQSIQQTFMPLTRIERVELKGADTTVFLKIRGIEACRRLALNEAKEWTVVENAGSPVYIKPEDRFLPVVRHTDRNGKLLKLQPMDFTFLSIQNITTDKQVICGVTSSQSSPLAGRKSRTAERLALVIRPTSEPSTLVVRSRDAVKAPVNGIKVYSTRPTARETELRLQTQEYLGKTDWQGKILIPPHEDGIRMLLLGRGGQGLLRVPVIPGLYSELTVEVPNDEQSLYAEGVFRSFESEILNLIIQRDVLEAEISALLEKNEVAAANERMKVYRTLESPNDIKFRLSAEKTQLEEAATGRQKQIIQKRFDDLSGILSQKAGVTRESELQAIIQVKSNVPGAIENPETKKE
jgi:hypothetical protein